jgi:hypothetical protein
MFAQRPRWLVGAITLSAMAALVTSVGLETTGCALGCNDGCTAWSTAALDLTCAPSDLQTVTATGPCAADGGGTFVGPPTSNLISVFSPTVGTCHVTLVFASGYTFSTNVTFAEMAGGGCGGCPPYIGATSGPISVNNPESTCVALVLDAGSDS